MKGTHLLHFVCCTECCSLDRGRALESGRCSMVDYHRLHRKDKDLPEAACSWENSSPPAGLRNVFVILLQAIRCNVHLTYATRQLCSSLTVLDKFLQTSLGVLNFCSKDDQKTPSTLIKPRVDKMQAAYAVHPKLFCSHGCSWFANAENWQWQYHWNRGGKHIPLQNQRRFSALYIEEEDCMLPEGTLEFP